jgi:hypothetical protein
VSVKTCGLFFFTRRVRIAFVNHHYRKLFLRIESRKFKLAAFFFGVIIGGFRRVFLPVGVLG